MNIYVGNISYNLKSEDIEAEFSRFGSVSKAIIIMDRETGRSKGFGFVEMPNDEEALNAISSLNEYEVSGRKLRVNEAIKKEDRPRNRY